MQICNGYPEPFQGTSTPRLDYVLRGIKKYQVQKNPTNQTRFPITPAILDKLKLQWQDSVGHPDTVILWAACCLGFFAFLRSQMTLPSTLSATLV